MIWHTEVRKISELKNWEGNPRTISEESYKTLKKSIGDLGNFEPLVINVDGTVLAGNQRLRVHKEQGDTEVEVSVPERELTEGEIKKIGIISNRHSGEWDMDKLANEFEDVLTELGFDDLMPEVELDVKEDDYEEPEGLPIKVKLGEVWQLGKHRLMCGDSTKIEDVEKLMNGEKADMVFTSPPYNANAKTGEGDIFNNKGSKQMYKGVYKDNLSSDKYLQLAKDVLENCFAFTNGYIFWNVSYNANSRYEYIKQIEDRLEYLIEQICWKKSSAIPIKGSMRRTWEPIYLFSTSKEGLGLDVVETNLWEISNTNSQLENHKACFPVALPSMGIKIVKNCKNLFDPFGGSGTTLIACEQTNRRCYMMELDEHYCTVILDRWEKLTGEQGVKLED